MKIRVYRSVKNGVLSVRVQTEDWGQSDVDKMRAFGEPEIDVGGLVSCRSDMVSSGGREAGSNDLVEYDFPSEFRKVMSGSPFVRRFDSRVYPDPESPAMLWKREMINRIITAVSWLRDADLSFVGEEVYNV